MSLLSLALLRRAAAYAGVLALLLLIVPPVLNFLGVLGPTLDEEIQSVARSLEAARAYGASPDEPHYLRASGALQTARELVGRQERWRGRRAIEDARRLAIDAQRVALASREDSRRQAQKVVMELDRLVNELEDIYAEATRSLPKDEVSRLFSMMKAVRQKSAAVILAFEEESYARVVEDAQAAREALLAAKAELRAARPRPRSTASPR